MKNILLLCVLFFSAGCAKISNWTSTATPEAEQTGDPAYDNKNEVKVVVPWNLIVYNFTNIVKTSLF